jgi:hypothetical protein
MLFISGFINASLLLAISFIHIYWAFGGKWGGDKAVPEMEGKMVFKPGIIATLMVALGLAFMAFISIARTGLFKGLLSVDVVKILVWIMAGIFALRAIGGFKYVGLFKKVRSTSFAQYDTKFYTPLCLVIAFNYLTMNSL